MSKDTKQPVKTVKCMICGMRYPVTHKACPSCMQAHKGSKK